MIKKQKTLHAKAVIGFLLLFFFYPNISETCSKSFLISRCCGHCASHLPQRIQSAAVPRSFIAFR